MVKKSAEGTLFFDYGTSETAEEIRFDHDYSSVSDMDFSTKQLLVGTGNKEVFTKNTNVVSEYEGLYLLQFNTVEETRSAYSYYEDKVDFIIVDSRDFAVSDGEDLASNESEEKKDALTELKEALEEKEFKEYWTFL